MRILLIAFMGLFAFSSVNGQATGEKLSKKESKSVLSSLNQDEKVRLLTQLIKDNPKLIEKTLKKALKGADKGVIDNFMEKKDMVFTPMQTTKVQEKAAAVRAEKAEKEAIKAKAIAEAKKEAKVEMTKPSAPQSKYVVKDKSAGPATTIKFEETTFDFGEITDGEKVTHIYKFTNTGEHPYIISNAKGSCGCTVPEWPRTPIAPGETGEIKVTFNSRNKGREGGVNQSKRVTLTGNTDPSNTYLTIKGIVKK